MQVTIEIPEEHEERFSTATERLGMQPEELAQAAVLEFLDHDADFEKAASYVLAKNAELYDRLS